MLRILQAGTGGYRAPITEQNARLRTAGQSLAVLHLPHPATSPATRLNGDAFQREYRPAPFSRPDVDETRFGVRSSERLTAKAQAATAISPAVPESGKTFPVLDYRAIRQREPETLKALYDSFHQYGFVGVAKHPVPPRLVKAYYQALSQFFALPEAVKMAYLREDLGRARGYYELGKETKTRIVNGESVRVPDAKENWHSGSPDTFNLYPREVTAFRRVNSRLYRELEAMGIELLSALGDYVGDQGLLRSLVMQDGRPISSSLFRSIHYPPFAPAEIDRLLAESPDGEVIRAGKHTDINLLTILLQATERGLQIFPEGPDGPPMHAPTGPNIAIVNGGDMLSLLTGGTLDHASGKLRTQGDLPSIFHQVVGDRDNLSKARYSLPLFLAPHLEKQLAHHKALLPPGAWPSPEPPIVAGEMQRLRLAGHGSLAGIHALAEYLARMRPTLIPLKPAIAEKKADSARMQGHQSPERAAKRNRLDRQV